MANNRISVIIDVTVDKANQALGSFKKSIQDADGAAGKFKAGAGAALDSVKANAANLAMAGGAALIAFGAKSISAFQDTALEAGKLRDSLGVTAEEASRLMEVAEDLGIGTETLEKSIGIMNRTAANTPAAFEAIGAELVKNVDGTTNVNETFLSTIDALKRIPDASARAAAAQKVFGRNWMEMAELIELGADGVRTALDSVEAGKIIDDAEVKKAREFRDALDALKGVSEELTVQVGSALVPVITDLAEALLEVKEVGGDLADLIPGPVVKGFELLGEQAQRSLFWPKYFLDFRDALVKTEKTTGTLGKSITDMADETERGTNIMSDADIAAGRLAAQVDDLAQSYVNLRNELSDRSAYLDLQDSFDDVLAKGMAAFDGTEESARAYERAQIDLTTRVLDYAEEIGNIPADVMTDVQALIDEKKYAEAERRLALFEKIRIARITPETFMPSTKVSGYRASGGPVSAGGAYVVGEDGPELLQMGSQSGRVIPNGATVGGINVTINTGADPNAVIDVIRKYQRYNGTNWGT